MNPDDTHGAGEGSARSPAGGSAGTPAGTPAGGPAGTPAGGPAGSPAGGPAGTPAGNPGDGSGARRGSTPGDAAEGSRLRTAGQLVEGGGLAGGLTTLLYVVIGLGFWSLVGWGADRVLGTRWIVVLGACIGAVSGIYVVYLHMQAGLRRSPTSDGGDPQDPHQSGPDSAPRP